MKPTKFHPEAEVELTESASYYENRRENLGRRFLEAAQSTIKRIEIKPSIYKFIDTEIQWCRLKTFPYAIIFRETETSIEILAIMHIRRQPNYWKNRK